MKKTTESRPLRPFSAPEHCFKTLRYRHDPEGSFRDVLDVPSEILDLDDLRTEAVHEFVVGIDIDKLRACYAGDAEHLSLLVIARDPIARRVLQFHRDDLRAGEIVVVAAPEEIRRSSLRDSIRFEFAIVLNKDFPFRQSRPYRKGSWVAREPFLVTRDLTGPTIPFYRAKSEEFISKRLPADSTWWLNVFEGAESLTKTADRLEDVFRVWVHEDIWTVLQEVGRTRGDQAFGKSFAAGVLVEILDVGAAGIRENEPVEERSVVDRLLSWLAEKHKIHAAELMRRLRTDGSANLLPLVWAALDCNRALKSADFRSAAE